MSVGEGRPAQAPGDVLARSSALVADGRFDENLELLRRAAEDHRDHVEVVLRAAAAEQDADHDRAAQLLERAVSLAPEDAAVLTCAGFGALALGDLDRALEWAERAGRLTVDDPDFPLAFDLGHLGGRIFVARGRDDLAERLLEIAFEELPQALGYGLELAHLLVRDGRDEEALAVIEKALAVRPDDQELTEERVLLRVNLYGPDELPPGWTIETPDDRAPRP
ncbi:MAG: tetratricopeptide repeat protein [Thermoleophilaceae bacterium]|nr:tetratricopeptide repeat protein [Thermoleophilaceae bacterium]